MLLEFGTDIVNILILIKEKKASLCRFGLMFGKSTLRCCLACVLVV